MKYALLLFALFFCNHLTMAQQKPAIKIHCVAPVKLKTGQSVKLKVSVSHNLKDENTGTLVLSLINHQTNRWVLYRVSGFNWILNLQPIR